MLKGLREEMSFNKWFINYLLTSEAVFGFILRCSSPFFPKQKLKSKIRSSSENGLFHQSGTKPPPQHPPPPTHPTLVWVFRHVWNPHNYTRSLERLLSWMQRCTASPPSAEPCSGANQHPSCFLLGSDLFPLNAQSPSQTSENEGQGLTRGRPGSCRVRRREWKKAIRRSSWMGCDRPLMG